MPSGWHRAEFKIVNSKESNIFISQVYLLKFVIRPWHTFFVYIRQEEKVCGQVRSITLILLQFLHLSEGWFWTMFLRSVIPILFTAFKSLPRRLCLQNFSPLSYNPPLFLQNVHKLVYTRIFSCLPEETFNLYPWIKLVVEANNILILCLQAVKKLGVIFVPTSLRLKLNSSYLNN